MPAGCLEAGAAVRTAHTESGVRLLLGIWGSLFSPGLSLCDWSFQLLNPGAGPSPPP